MSLETGSQIGPYRILRPIGAGGMGEVYAALDPALGREVAIKVLPQEFALLPERRSRFEREAKALAQLSHPNLVQIYAFSTHEEAPFLAMELLQGQTLRERLEGRGLPVRRVVDYARQIAAGLAAAHDRGIIHRDLKPDNVFVTREGPLKLLDFGLAKATPSSEPSDPNGTTEIGSGGLHHELTEAGRTLGTSGYMSPEQVRGQGVDLRSDLFSFGILLYEMLAGKRPFQGESTVDTLHAILREDPPPLPSTLNVPATLIHILARCLEKEPEARFRSAQDLGFALEELALGTSSASQGTLRVPASARFTRRWLHLMAAGLGLLGLGSAAGWLAHRPVKAHYQQMLEDRFEVTHACFLPDGQAVVFSATQNGEREALYHLSAPGAQPRPLGVLGSVLGVSPTGDLAILVKAHASDSQGELAVLPASGGAPRPLAKDIAWAAWGPEGTDLILKHTRHQGRRVQLITYRDQKLFETRDRLHGLGHFVVSPAKDAIAFFENVIGKKDQADLIVVGLDGKERRRISLNGQVHSGLVWDERGLVTLQSLPQAKDLANLVRIDPKRGRVEVILADTTLGELMDVSSGGDFLVFPGGLSSDLDAAQWLKPGQDNPELLTWGNGYFNQAFLSGDGNHLAFTTSTGWSFAAFLQTAESNLPIRLAEGFAKGISGDGKWVLVNPLEGKARLVSTTGGEERVLPGSWFHSKAFLSWDASRALLVGRKGGPPAVDGSFLVDTVSGQERVLNPAIMGPLSPDGQRAFKAEGRTISPAWRLVNLDSGEEWPLPAQAQGKVPSAWEADGKGLWLLASPAGKPDLHQIWRCDLSRGTVTLHRQLDAPPSAMGSLGFPPGLSADGRAWARTVGRSNPLRTSFFRLKLR